MNQIWEVIAKNVSRNKKTFIGNVVLLFVLALLTAVFCGFSFSLNKAMKSAEASFLSEKKFTATVDSAFLNDSERQNALRSLEGLKQLYVYGSDVFFTPQGLKLKIDGVEKPLSAFNLKYADDFSEGEKNEFAAKTDENLLKFGRLPDSNSNEIACTEGFLKGVGFESAVDAVGRELLLTATAFDPQTHTASEKNLIDGATIVGVVNDNLGKLSVYKSGFLPTVFLPLSKINPTGNTFVYADFFFDSYFTRDAFLGGLKSALPAGYDIVDAGDRSAMAALEAQNKLVTAVFSAVGAIFFIGAALNGVFGVHRAISDKNGSYAVFLAEGMTKPKLWASIFIENLFALIIAVAAAFVFSIPIALGINAAVNSVGAFGLGLDFGVLGVSCAVCAGVGLFCVLAVSMIPFAAFSKKIK